jgi:hypothetical protein
VYRRTALKLWDCTPTMPRSRHFAAASTEYWSAGNQSTNSSASFMRVLFALIAGVDGMRKS